MRSSNPKEGQKAVANVRNVIAVAGGESQARAVLAVIRGKLVTHLVTDEDDALECLLTNS